MNIHFYNFIAAFNHAAKTKKWTFTIPLRNKFVLTFTQFLFREKLIDSYNIDGVLPRGFHSGERAVFLPSKYSSQCVRLTIHLKHDVIGRIHTMTRPGEFRFLTARKLVNFAAGQAGAAAVVVCSSSDLGRLCTAPELISLGKGGLVICTVELK